MLTCHAVPGSNIVELMIDGAITRDDFNVVTAEIDRKIDEFGSVDVLKEVRNTGKMPLSVLWDDLKWLAGRWRKVGRVAVVCDKDWVETLTELMQKAVAADIRHFDLDEIDEARRWLRDGLD